MTNMLKRFLAKLISKTNMLLRKVYVLHVVLMTNEVIDTILKSDKGGILCKLDIEKAYDYVEWSFLC